MRTVVAAALILIGFTTGPAQAAKLRPFGILNGPLVRLSDLFDGLGAAGREVLGPGPAPGKEIVVPAAQLAAIATEFGVDWQPRVSGVQAVLERPGRPLRRAEAIQALQPALIAHGAPGESRITLAGFDPPDVPPGAAVTVSVSQLDYDRASGAFSAVLTVTAAAMEAADFVLSGSAERTVPILVARHVLMPGVALSSADFKPAEVPPGSLAGEVARTPQAVIGMEVTRAIARDQPVPLADLHRPPLVRRGQHVLILLREAGLQLTEQGKALEGGAMDAQIRVLNPVSHAVLQASVTGPGTVSVVPGSLPIAAPGTGPATGYAEYAAQ